MAKKNKFVIKSKEEVNKWLNIANLVAKSLLPGREALSAFNSISAENRISIRKEFEKYDEIRRRKIPIEEANTETWQISVMVDAHIIATEYDIDPLVVLMCVDPPCKANQAIICR